MKLKVFAALAAVLGLTSCMQMEPPTKVDFLTQVKPLWNHAAWNANSTNTSAQG